MIATALVTAWAVPGSVALATDPIGDTVDDVTDTVEDPVDEIEDVADDTVDGIVGDAGDDGGTSTDTGSGDGGGGGGVSDTVDDVTDTVADGVDAVGSVGDGVDDTTEGAAGATGGTDGGTGGDTRGAADDDPFGSPTEGADSTQLSVSTSSDVETREGDVGAAGGDADEVAEGGGIVRPSDGTFDVCFDDLCVEPAGSFGALGALFWSFENGGRVLEALGAGLPITGTDLLHLVALAAALLFAGALSVRARAFRRARSAAAGT